MSIKVFISTTPGSIRIKKDQQMLSSILCSKKIDYEEIDLTDPRNEVRKAALVEEIKDKNLIFRPPMIYHDEEYLGNFDDFFESLETENLEHFFKIPGSIEKSFNDIVAQIETAPTEAAVDQVNDETSTSASSGASSDDESKSVEDLEDKLTGEIEETTNEVSYSQEDIEEKKDVPTSSASESKTDEEKQIIKTENNEKDVSEESSSESSSDESETEEESDGKSKQITESIAQDTCTVIPDGNIKKNETSSSESSSSAESESDESDKKEMSKPETEVKKDESSDSESSDASDSDSP